MNAWKEMMNTSKLGGGIIYLLTIFDAHNKYSR